MKHLFLFIALFASINFANAQVETPDAIFDFKALTSTPLNPRVLSTVEKDGIVTEEVRFHSEKDGEKDVDVFGYLSYPKGAKKLPAFIWNMPSMARASTYWTELGARRGYATLCIDMPLPGYRSTGSYPIGWHFAPNTPPRENPMVHGAVALLKSVSYLESRDEVDQNRIGMAGSSWGGFWSTMMAGIDPRIKAASAMFGAGALQEGNVWWHADPKKFDAKFLEQWRMTLDPTFRLPKSKAAIAWFTGTNDHFFWPPSVMKTYERAGGPKHLTLMPNWNHGLPPRQDEQVFVWLDIHLKNEPVFLKVSPVGTGPHRDGLLVHWSFSGPRQIKEAHLILSPGKAGNWENRPWTSLPAKVEGNVCSVVVPYNAVPYYISGTVTDSEDYISSTPLVVADENYILREKPTKPNYDGAASWGNFEPDAIWFLKGLAFANPSVSNDAHEGKQAIALTTGKNTLRPLYYVAGIKHRLAVYLKADKPTSIKIELNGNFDNVPQLESKEFAIGITWTKVELDLTPRESKIGNIHVNFLVPDNAKVVADTLSFKPIN